MSFPRYKKYRKSNVEWIDEIPAHWDVCALNYRYDVALGKMLDEKKITGRHLATYLRNVDVQWGRINTDELPEMDFDDEDRLRYSLQLGDLLVCEGGEVGRAAIWDARISECYYQKALHRIRARDRRRDTVSFLFFSFLAAAKLGVFAASGGRSTISHLTAEALRRCRFAFPPLSEQTLMADFLAQETAKIDALIAEQERLIELLKEKRQAVISQAVTKGMKLSAPMRHSGVEWIGDVPLSWEVLKGSMLGTLFGSEQVPEERITNEGDLPFIKVSSLSGNSLSIQRWEWFLDSSIPTEYRPRSHYVVFPKRGAAIFLNKVNIVERPSLIDPNLMGWELNGKVDPQYVAYILSTRKLQEIADVSTVPQINNKHIAAERFPVPPLREQRDIVEFVSSKVTELDQLTSECHALCFLLRERRSALISAAVTGQIDVRGPAEQKAA